MSSINTYIIVFAVLLTAIYLELTFDSSSMPRDSSSFSFSQAVPLNKSPTPPKSIKIDPALAPLPIHVPINAPPTEIDLRATVSIIYPVPNKVTTKPELKFREMWPSSLPFLVRRVLHIDDQIIELPSPGIGKAVNHSVTIAMNGIRAGYHVATVKLLRDKEIVASATTTFQFAEEDGEGSKKKSKKTKKKKTMMTKKVKRTKKSKGEAESIKNMPTLMIERELSQWTMEANNKDSQRRRAQLEAELHDRIFN